METHLDVCLSLCYCATMKAWHVLRTTTGREEAVVLRLSRDNVTSYVPLTYTRKRHRRTKVAIDSTTPAFPGYVFVETDGSQWPYIRSTKDVLSVLKGPDGTDEPYRLDPLVVLGLRELEKVHKLKPLDPNEKRIGDEAILDVMGRQLKAYVDRVTPAKFVYKAFALGGVVTVTELR